MIEQKNGVKGRKRYENIAFSKRVTCFEFYRAFLKPVSLVLLSKKGVI